jgi:hypothetical protein
MTERERIPSYSLAGGFIIEETNCPVYILYNNHAYFGVYGRGRCLDRMGNLDMKQINKLQKFQYQLHIRELQYSADMEFLKIIFSSI